MLQPEFKVDQRIFTMVEGGEDRYGRITVVTPTVQGPYLTGTITGYTYDISYDEGGTAQDVDPRKIYRPWSP